MIIIVKKTKTKIPKIYIVDFVLAHIFDQIELNTCL